MFIVVSQTPSPSQQSSEARVINDQDIALSQKSTSKDSDRKAKRKAALHAMSPPAKRCSTIDLATTSNTSTVFDSLVNNSTPSDKVSASDGVQVWDEC